MNKTNNNKKGFFTLTARSELSGPEAASQGSQIQIFIKCHQTKSNFYS